MHKFSTLNFIKEIQNTVSTFLADSYDHVVEPDKVIVNTTSKDFDGDYTVVLFPFVKALKKSPNELGEELGKAIVSSSNSLCKGFNIIKGFLNLELSNESWKTLLKHVFETKDSLGKDQMPEQISLVEFSSPNTNKPLHLGHIRNILLGWSCSMILKEVGQKVINTQIVNDRGVAICKSMLAWEKAGANETPENTGIKGDHLVGKYYVAFDKLFNQEYKDWQSTEDAQNLYVEKKKEDQSQEGFFKGYKNQYFNNQSKIGSETREMLLKWEDQDAAVRSLWEQMNAWVYDGFDKTYEALRVSFDKIYYESETYKLGKSIIEQYLQKGLFFKKEDGSIWVDLEDVGLDKKLLLRSDGTSVYITQDIGTAQKRYEDFSMDKMVYVVGNEQDYHFQALFETLKKMGASYADSLYHLSYGMVDLPSGKMKSREGTVVDADDLIAEVIAEARASAQEFGNLESLTEAEKEEIFTRIGLGALKYFIIKVHPKKRMTFDPKQSVDMQGQTGPYIQNAFVRVQSILRKSDGTNGSFAAYESVEEAEKQLLVLIASFPTVLLEAAVELDPSKVANFAYALAKEFHRFYHDVRILNAPDEARNFRITLIETVATILERSMRLLGIDMPARM